MNDQINQLNKENTSLKRKVQESSAAQVASKIKKEKIESLDEEKKQISEKLSQSEANLAAKIGECDDVRDMNEKLGLRIQIRDEQNEKLEEEKKKAEEDNIMLKDENQFLKRSNGQLKRRYSEMEKKYKDAKNNTVIITAESSQQPAICQWEWIFLKCLRMTKTYCNKVQKSFEN